MCDIFNRVNKQAELFPNKKAIIGDSGKVLTYSQLINSVRKYAAFFQCKVSEKNANIVVCMQEGSHIPITVLALNLLKHTIIPLNSNLKSNQLSVLISSVDADSVIVDLSTIHLFKDINTILVDDEISDYDYESKPIISCRNTDSYDNFIITLSSGSTGNPKPIILSEQVKIKRFKQAVDLYSVTSNDIIMCASPFFHSLGQRLTLLPLMSGGTLVQLTNFTATKWCEYVLKYRITFTISVSSHLHLVLEDMLESPNDFISLRCLVSSSASINKKVKLKLFDLLDCDFHEMYGATEVATATNLSQAYSLKKPTSVGVPCENVEVRIVDDSFLDKEIMEQGKIIIKSPLSSSGYYNLPDLTNSSFVSGYFVTGDLGFLDEDGFLYFTNREKDIIISGGENIYPSDIEFYINQHDLIEDSTVVSVNDDYFGEVPVAVIISIGCKNNKLIEREVRSFLRDNLLPNQQPMKYFFSEKFPLTLSGKLDKKKIQKDINELGLDLSAKLRQIKGICDE